MHVLLQRVRKCKCLRGELHIRSIQMRAYRCRLRRRRRRRHHHHCRWKVGRLFLTHSVTCIHKNAVFFATIRNVFCLVDFSSFLYAHSTFRCVRLLACYKWMAINLRRHISTHVIETSAAMGALVVMECDTQLMHSCNVHREWASERKTETHSLSNRYFALPFHLTQLSSSRQIR